MVVTKATIKALFARRPLSSSPEAQESPTASDTTSYSNVLPSDLGSSLSSSLSSTKAFDFIGKAQSQTATTVQNISVHPLDLSLARTRRTSGSFFAGHDRELERDTLRKSSAFTRQTRQSSAFTFASDRLEDASSETASSSGGVDVSTQTPQRIDDAAHSSSSESATYDKGQQVFDLGSPVKAPASPEIDTSHGLSEDESILVTTGPEIRKNDDHLYFRSPFKPPPTLPTATNEVADIATSENTTAPQALLEPSADVHDKIKAGHAALAAQGAAKLSRFASYFARKQQTNAAATSKETSPGHTIAVFNQDPQAASQAIALGNKLSNRKPTPLDLGHLFSSDASGRLAVSIDEALPGLREPTHLSLDDATTPVASEDERQEALGRRHEPISSTDLIRLEKKPRYANPAAARAKHTHITTKDAETIARTRPGTPFTYGKAEKKLLGSNSPAPFDPDESMTVNAPASPQLLDLPHDGLPRQPYDGKARTAILKKPLPVDPPQPRDLQSELDEASAHDFEGFDGFEQHIGRGKARATSWGSEEENRVQQPPHDYGHDGLDDPVHQASPSHVPTRFTRSRSVDTVLTTAGSETFSDIRQRIAQSIARDVYYEGRYQFLTPRTPGGLHQPAGAGPVTDPRKIIPQFPHHFTTRAQPSILRRTSTGSWETENEEYKHRRARFVQLDRPWTPRPRSARFDQFAELYTKVSKFDPHRRSPTHTPTIYDSSSSGGENAGPRIYDTDIPIGRTDDTVRYSPSRNLEFDEQIKAWLNSKENDVDHRKRLQLLFAQRGKHGISVLELWPDDGVRRSQIDGGLWNNNDTGSSEDEDDPERMRYHRLLALAMMEGDFEVFKREDEKEIRAYVKHHDLEVLNYIWPQWIQCPAPRRPWKEAGVAATKNRSEDQLQTVTPPLLVKLDAHERDLHTSANGGLYQKRRVPDRFRDELL